MSEWLDVVDLSDRTLRQESREVVHAQCLPHRAVSVWLATNDGSLWIQQRSTSKPQEPGLYSPTASGHVDAGETYDLAAARELKEEAGLSAPILHVTTLPPSEETGQEFTAVFVGETTDQPDPCPVEVHQMRKVTREELSAWLRRKPGDFSSSFHVVYRWLTTHRQLPGAYPC